MESMEINSSTCMKNNHLRITTNMNNTTQYEYNTPILISLLQLPSSVFNTEIWILEMESVGLSYLYLYFLKFIFAKKRREPRRH